MSATGVVFDIKQFSLHDGPGIRTTVFLKGCGLRCWWCHNPESRAFQPELLLRAERCIECGACLAACPEGAIARNANGYVTDRARCVACGQCTEVCYAEAREIVGRVMSVDEVLTAVLRDRAFYEESGGGVTCSGGEPLLQPGFLLPLLQACQHAGLHTAVDTCGYVRTDALQAAAPYVDLFLYDLKTLDAARHRTVTGVSNERILRHLRLLSDAGARIFLRVPVLPGINDADAEIDQLGALVRTLPGVERVDLLAYHQMGSEKHARLGHANPMPPTEAPSEARMHALRQRLEQVGLAVQIGG